MFSVFITNTNFMRKNLTHHLLASKDEQQAKRLGSNWKQIRFEAFEHQASANKDEQPKVGTFYFNDRVKVDVTVSEINRMMEELSDALVIINRGRRLGIISS